MKAGLTMTSEIASWIHFGDLHITDDYARNGIAAWELTFKRIGQWPLVMVTSSGNEWLIADDNRTARGLAPLRVRVRGDGIEIESARKWPSRRERERAAR